MFGRSHNLEFKLLLANSMLMSIVETIRWRGIIHLYHLPLYLTTCYIHTIDKMHIHTINKMQKTTLREVGSSHPPQLLPNLVVDVALMESLLQRVKTLVAFDLR